MRPRTGRRPRGFTLVELVAALVVIGLALSMLTALIMTARRAARLQSERRLASAAAAGAFERLRGAPLSELPGAGEKQLTLPPEAEKLKGVEISARAVPREGEPGLKHLRVTVAWRSRGGQLRRVVKEGLISDARER